MQSKSADIPARAYSAARRSLSISVRTGELVEVEREESADLGLRVFVTRWLAIFAEVRDYMYLETLESLDVALGVEQREE